jgi:hypothetical protein
LLPKKSKSGTPASSPADASAGVPKHATLRCEHVLCGRCPKKHGPYWYAYWRDRDGRVRKRYVGKKLPPELRVRLRRDIAKPSPATRPAAPHRRRPTAARPRTRRLERALTPARKRTRVRRNE